MRSKIVSETERERERERERESQSNESLRIHAHVVVQALSKRRGCLPSKCWVSGELRVEAEELTI